MRREDKEREIEQLLLKAKRDLKEIEIDLRIMERVFSLSPQHTLAPTNNVIH